MIIELRILNLHTEPFIFLPKSLFSESELSSVLMCRTSAVIFLDHIFISSHISQLWSTVLNNFLENSKPRLSGRSDAADMQSRSVVAGLTERVDLSAALQKDDVPI